MANVFESVTEQILAHLDKGVIPWKQPCTITIRPPRNLQTGKVYRRINVWLPLASRYASPSGSPSIKFESVAAQS